MYTKEMIGWAPDSFFWNLRKRTLADIDLASYSELALQNNALNSRKQMYRILFFSQ